MIALVKLRYGGGEHDVAMMDDGTWYCSLEPLRLALNALHDPLDASGPDLGDFGAYTVAAAVAAHQGRIIWQRPVEADELGRTY